MGHVEERGSLVRVGSKPIVVVILPSDVVVEDFLFLFLQFRFVIRAQWKSKSQMKVIESCEVALQQPRSVSRYVLVQVQGVLILGNETRIFLSWMEHQPTSWKIQWMKDGDVMCRRCH